MISGGGGDATTPHLVERAHTRTHTRTRVRTHTEALKAGGGKGNFNVETAAADGTGRIKTSQKVHAGCVQAAIATASFHRIWKNCLRTCSLSLQFQGHAVCRPTPEADSREPEDCFALF